MVAVRQTRSRHEELPLEDLANLASPVRAVLSHRVHLCESHCYLYFYLTCEFPSSACITLMAVSHRL
jgi:hypothetical protein